MSLFGLWSAKKPTHPTRDEQITALKVVLPKARTEQAGTDYVIGLQYSTEGMIDRLGNPVMYKDQSGNPITTLVFGLRM